LRYGRTVSHRRFPRSMMARRRSSECTLGNRPSSADCVRGVLRTSQADEISLLLQFVFSCDCSGFLMDSHQYFTYGFLDGKRNSRIVSDHR
jgi:hypothetical protein